MAYADEFRDDIQKFLRTYACGVSGAMGQNTESGATVRQQLSARPADAADQGDRPFDFTGGTVHAEIGAPKFHAYFRQQRAAEDTDVIPWSTEQVGINLDNAPLLNGVNGVPVYLIPYEGGRTLGVRLPAGDAHAFALTATQNGCTVEVSGEETEPYASHSNVINVPSANRQAAIVARAQRLQLAFNNALDEDAEDADPVNDPTRNRSMFGHYSTVPGFTNRMVDYSLNTGVAANGLTGPGGNRIAVKGARVGHGLKGHSRYHLTITDGSLNTLRAAPSQALVVGERRNGSWTFYHQSWGPLAFDVTRDRKFGGRILSTENIARKYATVVLSYGTLWPEISVNFTQFV